MKRYFLFLFVMVFSGFTLLDAQVVTYRTLKSSVTLNGVQGSPREDKTGRIKIDLRKKTITARVRSGFFRYEKDYEAKFVIDSVRKENSGDTLITVYSCHYAADAGAFVTVTDAFSKSRKLREVSFLNDNNMQKFVVK